MDLIKVWFRLLIPGSITTSTKVRIPSNADVEDFRDAVKAKYDYPGYLKDVPIPCLFVYENQAAFDTQQGPLKGSAPVKDFGKDVEMNALIVVLQRPYDSAGTSDIAISTADPKRKARWEMLNMILEPKKSKSNNSTPYSSITWSQTKNVFNPQVYIQQRQTIADEKLTLLFTYLKDATKCFSDLTCREAKRLHLIAPILICVCSLFNGDVEILLEEDLVGRIVKAHGHFEFMLKRKNKVVCIVEAKKDDMEQGIAQDLVGCEVAAELGGLNTVYGIVTSYIQWIFLRCTNEKVEKDERMLFVTPEGPTLSSLKMIAEKIYGMLADE